MQPENQTQLEHTIHRVLTALPDRKAPASLERRVLFELRRREALPWWRRSYAAWPAPAQAAFLASAASAAVLLVAVLTRGASLFQLPEVVSRPVMWLASVRDLGSTLATTGGNVVRALPAVWTYGFLAVIGSCYLTLVGLGAAAGRTLGLKTTKSLLSLAALLCGLPVLALAAPESAASDQVTVRSDNRVAAGAVVPNNAVAVMGDLTVDGRVSHDAVAVLGAVRINGAVEHDTVAVLGDVEINGPVGHDVVSVGGDVHLGPLARVGNDVVCVGGAVHADPAAVVKGRTVLQSPLWGGGHGDARTLSATWRPVWHHRWMWLGLFHAGVLLLYVLLAAVFPENVTRCGSMLAEHPGRVLLVGLLSLAALPVLFLLLLVTVVGIPVALLILPLTLIGLGIWGKTAVYGLIGRTLSRDRLHTALCVLLTGLIMVLLLVLAPAIGVLVSVLLMWLGFSCAATAILSSMQRSGPTPPSAPPASAAPELTLDGPPPATSAGQVKAGFWVRMAALLIDLVLVAVVCSPLAHVVRVTEGVSISSPEMLPLLALYGALMWKLRSTTIGGIILGLKVVRVDGRPMDWATVIVRALGCFLSVVALGLGFLWIAFDADHQAWHDKLAGTVVVRLPKGPPLV